VEDERGAGVRGELNGLSRGSVREEDEPSPVDPAQEDLTRGGTSVHIRGSERHRVRLRADGTGLGKPGLELRERIRREVGFVDLISMPVDSERDPRQTPRLMCLVFLLAIFAPRLALAFVWIFGDRVELAFDSWIWPLLGLIFLPWTTLAYVFLWSPVTGVEGAEWLVVALAVVVDVMWWISRSAKRRLGY
jgi:hypothetical protein